MDEINTVISLVIIQLFTYQLLHRNGPLMPLEMFGFRIFAHSGRRMGERKIAANFLLSRAFANLRVSNPPG